MKCRTCRGPAVIDVPASNANFCAEHFVAYCERQVEKAIKQYDMLRPGDRVLVAVSGGKDSLALWALLEALGYEAEGFCIGLGIGDYSEESSAYARRFAAEGGRVLHELSLPDAHGTTVPEAAEATKRPACSACGLSKRHLIDRAAVDGGFDVVATGHNLDDEAAVLFGNTLRWSTEYLGRQRPVLDAHDGFPRKVKPLVRLTERETAAYCIISGIDYMVEECPMAFGNRHLGYKQALDVVETTSPGAKHAYYHEFLAKAADRFVDTEPDAADLSPCTSCGAPCSNGVCAFCFLLDRIDHHRERVGAVPVSFRTEEP